MLTVAGLSKGYGGVSLFSGLSFQVNAGDRVGLIGPNGAGKSTLLEIIAGLEEPDGGRATLARGAAVGYLPQESAPARDETVLGMALERIHPDAEGDADHNWDDADPAREADAKRILRGLGFREDEFFRPARELSGGWVMRAHLARLLVSDPELLLLDEPTNHLDFDSVAWLTDHLAGSQNAVVVISHDRTFLNRLIRRVFDLERGNLTEYKGNYDSYRAQREAREEQLVAAYRNQEREVARLQTFVDRFGAKASKASQAQSKRKQIDKIRTLEAPDLRRSRIGFKFPQPPRSGAEVLRLDRARFAYGSQMLYDGLDLTIERGQKLAVLGRNGTGKSTLLKLLAGLLPLASGERTVGYNVALSYFSQQRMEMFQARRTVLEEALDTPDSPGEALARNVLGAFLFRGDDVRKPVSVLSGGEKSRLALAKLLLQPPNFLLLDEPTTHLDIGSIEALVGALVQYEGTVAFVSHDLYFVQALADRVLYLDGMGSRYYPGGLEYFQDRRAVEEGTAAPAEHLAPAPANPARPPDRERRRQEAEARQQRHVERKALEGRLGAVEARIAALETRQKQLIGDLGTAGAGNAARELGQLAAELQRLTAEWDRLAEAVQTS